MEEDIAGLLGHLRNVVMHASNLLRILQGENAHWLECSSEVGAVLAEYQDAVSHFGNIKYSRKLSTNLRYITLPERSDYLTQRGILRQVMMECKKAVSLLSSIATPLSTQELDRLNQLRGELNKIATLLPSEIFQQNLEAAISEYEQGHHLPSALITSRVIAYCLDQIAGKGDEARIRTLEQAGVISKDRDDLRQAILKSSRKSRNYLSHDIKISATPADALALLGDTLRIVEITARYTQARPENSK